MCLARRVALWVGIALVPVAGLVAYVTLPPLGHVSPTALNHSVAGKVGFGMGVEVRGAKGCTKVDSVRSTCEVHELSEGAYGTYLVTMRGRRCWTAGLRTGGDQHLLERVSGCVRLSDQLRLLGRLAGD